MKIFNSRAPCGARQTESGEALEWILFNPRAPCGARRDEDVIRSLEDFSIHGLRVEPDAERQRARAAAEHFQSTGSVWSPTRRAILGSPPEKFSIHGLRVEPDSQTERHSNKSWTFQSTGSVWSPTLRPV